MLRAYFCLLITATGIACATTGPARTGQLTAQGPSRGTLSVCELIRCSDAYRNTIVRVRGTIVAGYETFALWDPSCPTDNTTAGMIWLTTESPTYSVWAEIESTKDHLMSQVHGTEPDFFAALTWRPLQTVAFTPDRTWERLSRLLESNGTAMATLRGRLDYAGRGIALTPRSARPLVKWGFGHLNGFSRQLVLEGIEEVTRAPSLK